MTFDGDRLHGYGAPLNRCATSFGINLFQVGHVWFKMLQLEGSVESIGLIVIIE